MFQAEIQVRNILEVALGLDKDDRLLIIYDRENEKFARPLIEVAKKAVKRLEAIALEDFGSRPFTSLPEALREKILSFSPTASVFMATGKEGEVSFRLELLDLLLNNLEARHVHMPGLDEKIWETGMNVDYEKVAETTLRVYEAVKNAKEIVVKNNYGTDVKAVLGLKWVPDTGLVRKPGDFINLPAGEVYTCPLKVDGVFYAEILGDYFVKYGRLEEPVRFEFEDGYVVAIEASDPKLEEELIKYIFEGPEYSDRAGEFALGTNIFLKEPIGNLLQDEKLPGVHIAVGNPYPEKTGADWSSTVHLDFIALNTDVWVDGEKIMRKGKYLV